MSPLATHTRRLVTLLAFGLAAACDPDSPPPGAESDAARPPATVDDAPGTQPPRAGTDTLREEISPAPWDDARDRGAAWRGIGQEPGWTVEIHPGSRLVYVGDYGERTVSVPTPEPRQDGNRTIWQATTGDADIRVVFEALPCTDIMSGEEFPLSVTVTVNGEELRGCGRRL
jgi:putative lipoprotein